ncbi:MAG: cytochrome c maturation protein CcmE [Gammaproteobacteria bacterium]|nr:cytochrome c maturation protein CcmE [Gammaproteobacteria bacterium]
MKTRHRRLLFITAGVLALTGATLLVLNAFRSNLVFFHTPTEVAEGTAPLEQLIRIGGMVEENSVEKTSESLHVSFRVTDFDHSITVTYDGVLPDLFREGQGVVAEGRLRDSVFVADRVLAKHDENYMPPEVAAMKLDEKAQNTPKKYYK